MKTIAVIEDDVLLNEALSRMLAGAGYQILRAHTLREGLDLIPQLPDLMIIDINLPDGEGTEACRQAREYSQIPVLILTARDEERDMIKAFDLGAEAILRRTAGEETGILYRGLKISPERKQVLRDGTEIRLSAREYALLELLARNKGKVVTKTMILEQVWDADGSFVEENTVNVTLNRLKKKIEPDPVNPVYIRNVFGLGYTFGE